MTAETTMTARAGTRTQELRTLDMMGLVLAIVMTLGPLLATALFDH